MMNFQRFYHISCTNFSIKKQGIKLCKLLNPKTKKQWHPTPSFDYDTLPSLKSLTKVKNEPGKRGLRRTAMLNKMFMKKITDLMSTGTVSMDIVGRGIEISKVNVTPDFQTVNVFWVCKGNESDEETESILNKIAGALRHELSTLRVMGEIPYIMFVKDKQEALIVELDRRLARADFGEDYTPTELGHLLKSEFVSNTKLSSEVKAKIKQLEEQIRINDQPLPDMTHNIYGLDHAKIMNRLLAARKKNRDAWSHLSVDPSDVISYRASESQVEYDDVSNQRKELADFLLKRQNLQKQLQKKIREARRDWQLDMSEDEKGLGDDDDEDDEYYDDDDYDHDHDYDHDDYDRYRDVGGPPTKSTNNIVV